MRPPGAIDGFPSHQRDDVGEKFVLLQEQAIALEAVNEEVSVGEIGDVLALAFLHFFVNMCEHIGDGADVFWRMFCAEGFLFLKSRLSRSLR